MQKPLALSIAACLGFAGCQVFEKSATWEQAVRVRPAETTRDPDPSNAYASKLHRVFADRGVAHQVVVYQYRYTTRLREEAVGTRTAVIYRDDANPRHPWWLKDDRAIKPFWLPNGSLDQQVSFYLRRKAEVIEKTEFHGERGGGKTIIAFARSTPALRVAAEPRPAAPVVRASKKSSAPIVKRLAASPAPVVQAAPKPAPTVAAAPRTAAPKTAVPETKATRRSRSPVAFFTVPPALKSTAKEPEPTSGTWSPPAVLDAGEQTALTAPRDSHLEKLFRAKHGSDYNRFSPQDRRKMQQLQQGLAGAE